MSDEQKTLVFIDREGKPGGGKGLLISKELTFTLSGLRQNLLVWETEGEKSSCSFQKDGSTKILWRESDI